jgi:outer membrane protein assembly factor BamB
MADDGSQVRHIRVSEQPMNKRTRKTNSLVIAAAVAALSAVSTPSQGASRADLSADWPTWRGPARDDLSKDSGLLKEWPKGGPPLAWEAKGLGSGFSSVSVADGKIFTMGDAHGAEYVFAVNAADGTQAWSTKVGPPGKVDHPGSRTTPTVDGGLVYAQDPLGDLVCLKAADGSQVWHVHLEKDLKGGHPGWGYAESPLVDGDHLICTPGGKQGTLAALDKKTGIVVWRSEGVTDGAAYGSPVPADLGGRHQFIQLTEKSVFGVAADTGKLLWRAARQGQTAVVPTPIVHDNFVYVTSGYGVGCDLFKIDVSTSEFKAEKVYANKVMVNHHGGVILYQGNLYGYSDSGGWTCQRMSDGKALWQSGALGKGAIGYADGHFYLRDEGGAGTIVLIDATPDGFKERGRFNPQDRSRDNAWPHPVITGRKLYIRDQDVLLCYNVNAP